jgi:nucleoside-diphosphate-sugar epimerase
VATQGAVAITGATGSLGPAVVRQLIADGWTVRAFARRKPAPGVLPPEVQFIRGDLLDEVSLRAFLDGAYAVHHLAGQAHGTLVPSAGAAYRRVNVDGARVISQVARALRVPRFIYYSSTAVYGTTEGRSPVDELSPIEPKGEYAKSKAEAEKIILDTLGDASTILRLAAVYGPRLKGNYLRLFEAISRGRYVSVGRALNRRTVVFVDDVASAASIVTRTPDIRSRIFNVTDGEIHQLRAIITAIAVAVGKSPRSLYLPIGLAKVAARLLDLAAALRLSPTPGTSLLVKYLEDSAVRGDRLQTELGYRPAFDLGRGWRCVAGALGSGARKI